MELAGKVCLITGGTSGIGAATAAAFARRGAHVAVTGRSSRTHSIEMLQAIAAEHGAEITYIQADAGSAEGCARMVAETHALFGRVDVLVHAAGTAVPGGFFEVTEENWMKAFDVHVHAVLRLARAAVPHMIEQGEGAIILIGSAAGHRGCLGALAYGVVKGALPQFGRALARELADSNIRVNSVSPGIIRTPFQDFLTPEQVANNVKNRIPLHREGKPEHVASAILELVENDFITGEDLVIDGGMTMRIV
ncbi:SDR family NAD(P)-dependent oxidoreductase [Edaphobacter paludis]|uniref:SDR family NAD(P)-dependent oxidoreductase n=2 Tax=Edaphobacter paludis TaxID=3035702 RepID=A0AAU7D3U1_9BACT